jgi:flagellar biosynthetic protein FlhF
MQNASPRTFRGPTPRAALEAVKMAYGPDAIILATREIPGNVFRNREIEVLASAPTEEEAAPKEQPYAFMEQIEKNAEASMPPVNQNQKRRASSRAMAAFNEAAAQVQDPHVTVQRTATVPMTRSALNLQSQLQTPFSMDAETTQAPRVHVPSRKKVPARRDRRKTLQIQKELEEARQSMDTFSELSAFSGGAFQPPEGAPEESSSSEISSYVENQKQQMISRGMSANLADELMNDAQMLAGPKGTTEKVQQNLERMVSKSIQVANAPWSLDPSGHRRVMALVGPTGVGKTTTAAKIAARALMDHDMSVALITVDTYRIGAIDQLARYGELLGVPTYVARDRSSLLDALTHTRDKDLVIIDTAGRSPSDIQGMKLQSELLRSCPEVMLHLVVAASTEPRQLKRLEARYQTTAPERLIVTKLDESEGNATLMNIAAKISMPLSCVTNGQRVPEDLHWWNIPTIVEQVVGQ